ncbi:MULTISPECIES: hypothetical protein [unclassified Streptomyces]|uniref:hypothetical protein n=1 Tax=unclassified Streptomyces TaxID=2593676 RepID=UPI001164728C|nr:MULTISPECIES: hypothetical protein [unclassified Streptomyces]NMI54272.1 hypothetical protein [Streptomyces sp. RLA2-12]QDN63133.1 hypothetical protein FNV67_55570 [Streptomyces sp. S1D4-20]QDN73185.1 hypothetical protein FNV66_54450 [Streptomyces sp. S1D4-14]QDO55783.1 hypothetical protein FNV60_53865 [Streptomyces sp. RLB3-5]QDO56947.1 hypothetical protein FNV59_00305 [Streptomyces sp. RLB1-8]
MARDVMPFLRPAAHVLKTSPWEIGDAQDTRPLPLLLPDWDPQADLALHRHVTVDHRQALADCRLPAGTPLALVVDWHSSAAHFAGSAFHRRVVEESELTVRIRLSGADLGGTLVLKTRLVLADDVPRIDEGERFTPCHAGEILCEDISEVRLEGSASRFPISVIDFPLYGFDADARWAVGIPEDPAVPVVGGVRLYLNRADTELVTAAARASAPTPLQRRLLDTMYDDIARQLVEASLRPTWRDAVIEAADEPGSLAESLVVLISNLFRGESLEAVAVRRDAEPSVFAAALQGALRRTRQENA